jgi:hypothetical protein
MAEEEEDWRNDPDVLRKYTWEPGDVVWGKRQPGDPPPKPIEGLASVKERRHAWKRLFPNDPYPASLLLSDEDEEEDNGDNGNGDATADSARPRARSRPKVKLHIHR